VARRNFNAKQGFKPIASVLSTALSVISVKISMTAPGEDDPKLECFKMYSFLASWLASLVPEDATDKKERGNRAAASAVVAAVWDPLLIACSKAMAVDLEACYKQKTDVIAIATCFFDVVCLFDMQLTQQLRALLLLPGNACTCRNVLVSQCATCTCEWQGRTRFPALSMSMGCMWTARHCCTYCKFTPTITALSRLLVGDESQQTTDWYPEVGSPGTRQSLARLWRSGCKARASRSAAEMHPLATRVDIMHRFPTLQQNSSRKGTCHLRCHTYPACRRAERL
jgi:hypothetical protein